MTEKPPVITPGEDGLVTVCCGDACVTFQCGVRSKTEAHEIPSPIVWDPVNSPLRLRFQEMLTPELERKLAEAPSDARLVIHVQRPDDALELHDISEFADQIHEATGRETELRMVD